MTLALVNAKVQSVTTRQPPPSTVTAFKIDKVDPLLCGEVHIPLTYLEIAKRMGKVQEGSCLPLGFVLPEGVMQITMGPLGTYPVYLYRKQATQLKI